MGANESLISAPLGTRRSWAPAGPASATSAATKAAKAAKTGANGMGENSQGFGAPDIGRWARQMKGGPRPRRAVRTLDRLSGGTGRLAASTTARGTDVKENTVAGVGVRGFDGFAVLIYCVAFVTGAIVMSFEMLGSRYLNPHFGSGIYTWASLISTVLAALTLGYFLGGTLADRRPQAAVLGATVLIGSVYLLALPSFANWVLELVLDAFDDVRSGSLAAAMAIMVFPVTFLGMYSPFAIRLLLRSPHRSGVVSGTVYGISTAGSIVGTLGTTFFLIPAMGSRAITLSLGAAGGLAGLAGGCGRGPGSGAAPQSPPASGRSCGCWRGRRGRRRAPPTW